MMLAHIFFSYSQEVIERASIQGWSRTTKRQTHLVGYIDVALVIRLSGRLELVYVDFLIIELPWGATWKNES